MVNFFFLNGQKYGTYTENTIQEILNYFNYEINIFIIECNGIICNKNEWKKLKIRNNDKIEIVTIVGGG